MLPESGAISSRQTKLYKPTRLGWNFDPEIILLRCGVLGEGERFADLVDRHLVAVELLPVLEQNTPACDRGETEKQN